jgi:hypothetical protein
LREDLYGFDFERVGFGRVLVAGRYVGGLYHDYVAGAVVRQKDR